MRKIVLLVALVSLLVFVALPASAAVLDWSDYIDSYGEDYVVCVVPGDQFYIKVMSSTSTLSEHYGSGVTYSFSSGQTPRFQVFPFGYKNRMALKDIPNGTVLEYSLSVSASATALYGNMITYIEYFDSDLNSLGATILDQDATTLPFEYSVVHTMAFPDGAEYFSLWFYLQGWTTLSSAASYGISCSDLRFYMDVAYMPDDSTILDSINNKLDGVNDKLDGVSDQIDDMISGGAAGGQVSDQAGSVSDSVGQVDDFTSDIEAELNEGLANILDFSGLDSLAPAFVFIGKYVDKIWYSMGDLHVVYFFAFGLGVFLILTQHVPRVPSLKQQESQQEAHRNYVASLRRGHNPIDYSAHGNGQSHSYTVVQDSFFD